MGSHGDGVGGSLGIETGSISPQGRRPTTKDHERDGSETQRSCEPPGPDATALDFDFFEVSDEELLDMITFDEALDIVCDVK